MSVYVSDQSQFPRRIRFDWISEAFSIYGKNVGVWIGVMLIYGGVTLVLGFAFGAFAPLIETIRRTPGYVPTPMPLATSVPYYVLSVLIQSFFYAGQFKMANKAVRGEPVSIGDLFSGINVILPVLGYTFLFGIAIFLGAILCILPVFVVYTALWPGYALVVDGESVGNALPRSWNAVKQDWLNAALFSFVMLLLVGVSYIPCGLGLFVTVPMLFIIGSLIYRDMIGMPGAGTESRGGGPYYATPNTAGGVWPPAPTQGVPPSTSPFPQTANPFPPLTNPTPPNPTDAFPPPTDPYAPPTPGPPPSGE